MTRALALLTCLLSLAAFAELTPEKAAEVARDRQKAIDAVAKKYGNKKSSELTPDERRQIIRDENDAVSKVLEQHGVGAKEFSRYEATASKDQRAAQKDRAAALDKKDADEKKAADAKKKAGEKKGVEVEVGGADVEEQNGVIIERGTGDKKKR